MAHDHKLAIFRGLITFKSNERKIWGVFAFLSVVTVVEVALGIIKPEVLTENRFLAMKLLNWIFIVLTLVKAYYITWDFMHMRDEVKPLRRAVVWTAIFLICYLVLILLIEGDYIYEVYKNNYMKFTF
ncbi:MAG: cytochrome C oxidase subunit IV family protein [Bacteroidia bacterium]|nr:cytochrome C oxidase subunit IV family protein [Bacteroidia bacterium]NNF30559.1 cytochrome C oxidase subunit IV family protein [Flavobacteriaceae bacterium]MBT8277107.1 cytochrome C oxidase subunit IV family protein [Bacteroidia bacterium]NNJ83127.1 cytochrome C oxidase subunit IV family protein [Flavobacteriaceae bacterium]NNK53120.1 cytochrome C oxidase subunit IV family protein [Flavobacteriaceae bacterium]